MSITALRRCIRDIVDPTTSRVARRGLATHQDKAHRLVSGIILNRSPILTRTPDAFEKAFYDYQARIHRVLSNPFPNEFYFKPGSPLEQKFKDEENERELEAFGKGFGAKRERSEAEEGEEDEMELSVDDTDPPASRISEADVTGDVKSLDRKGERNLYLLVKGNANQDNSWRFPQGLAQRSEFLHEAAQREMNRECGVEMNSWLVGRRPIGFYEQKGGELNDKIFFFKAHILAGQAKPDPKAITDFAWLTKEEIQSHVPEEYWLGTKDMLSDF